jgi:hypothetical protein
MERNNTVKYGIGIKENYFSTLKPLRFEIKKFG